MRSLHSHRHGHHSFTDAGLRQMLPVATKSEHTATVLETILVAYDDSAPARRALEQAAHLAALGAAGSS